MSEAPIMSSTALGRMASDFEEMPVPANGGDWRMAWHPAGRVPAGQPHGANAYCVTARGNVVLISPGGSLHGAGPAAVPSEASHGRNAAQARDARRSVRDGSRRRDYSEFVKFEDASARPFEEGRVLVRSIWRAEVTLLPWRPEHEIPFRRVVPARDLARHLWMEDGAGPVYSRAAREAALA